MKVVKFFSIALVGSFLVASSMFAADVDKSNTDVKAAENSIREQVAGALANVAVEDADCVYVQFAISANSGFELIDVKGSNEALVSSVKKALTSNAIVNSAVLNGTYLLKVSFVTM